MIYSKIAPLPHHIYLQVDSRFTHKEPCGLQEAMWVGVTSIPGRMWGLNVIFRNGGMLYRGIPPHAVSFSRNDCRWTEKESQLWDCYSSDFTLIHNPILTGFRMLAKCGDRIHRGEYLFETTHLNDGWSNTPEQDKTFYFIRLDNGRLTILPTNRIVFSDKSFIENTTQIPRLKLSESIYTCE
jgi:hypothetical protein